MSEETSVNDNYYAKPKQLGLSTALIMLALALVVGFIAGTRKDELLANIGMSTGQKGSLDLSSVQKTYQQLQSNYDGKLDMQKLIAGANRGMVAGAGDHYTVFMDSKEVEDFNKDLTGEVSGIGAEVGMRSNQPTIIRPISGSPAEQSGVKPGDVIVKVNETIVRDMPLDKVVEQIRGKAGTSVKMTVRRTQDIKEFTITRATVSDASVRSEVKDGIGIIKITRFDDQTGTLARSAAEDLKSKNVSSIILDLRDNGGGYVTAAQQVAELWLPNKVVVTEKQGAKVVEEIKTGNNATLNGMKTIVLVNGGSASASEIVAGALKDYGAATLVGEKTFGKGSVQKIVDLPDGAQLKVTVARWYTPKGVNINEKGIEVDKEVKMMLSDVDAGADPQLDAAIQQSTN